MRNTLIILAGVGSAALLLGALGFQYIGELAPCKLCYWQRYPHAAAIVIALIALIALGVAGRLLPLMGMLAALTTAAVGLYHTGVERDWWEGPTTCTSSSVADVATDDLFAQIMAAPLVRCDEVAWQLAGLSMASWNAIVSVGLALIWLAAANHSR